TCAGAGSGTCPASGSGNINTSAVNLPSGGSATFTATCTISAAATGSLVNTATVSSSVTDPTPGNNSATDTDTLTSCSFTLTPPNQVVGSSSGTGNVVGVGASDSGCAWTAVSNTPSWITVTGGSTGTGNDSVTYSVGVNPGPNPRRGTMTIAGKTFIVSQATPVPAPCTITISPTSATFAAAGGPGTIPITASTPTCSWSARSHVPWITITSGASGAGAGTVQYTVATNPGPNSRAGRITVNGKRFTVTQTP
ncbi:MAG: BACON domain-containing protein, partial [Deltaproteobacteria bacterium]|nr:BACON domain-containing protein [Deltaproteobacteria bacterium]